MRQKRWHPIGLAAVLSLLSAIVAAQQPAAVAGRVNSVSGTPLPSVSVFLDGMSIGALSTEDGRYTFVVPAGRATGQTATLTARILGYKPQSVQITLTAGQQITRDFVLVANPLQLGEVIITGAGTVTTREKLGNSINTVRADEIVRSNEANIVSAIAGKAPNVEVQSTSGEPGSGSYIRIRGPKTIQGTGQPLFVVDGVPIDNSTNSLTLLEEQGVSQTVNTNRAADINPSDIQSVEILKGAAAAAIYGSRAGQGVVLITTKSGRPGPTRYSLRSSYSIDEVNKGIPLQRSFGQGSGGVAPVCAGPGCRVSSATWGPELPSGTQTYDHFNELFDNGYSSDNTLSVSGGNERTSFYLSTGLLYQDGTIKGPNNHYQRTTARLKATHRLRDDLSVGGNIAYADGRGSFIQKGSNVSGLLLGAARTPPEFNNQPYLDSTGLHRSFRYPRPNELRVGRGYDNPFFVINENPSDVRVGRAYGNVNVDYNPNEWLGLKYTLGTDYSGDDRIEGLALGSSTQPQGRVISASFTTLQLDHNLVATGTRTFSPNFGASLTLGQNLNSRRYRQIYAAGFQLISPGQFQLDNAVTVDPDEFESLIHTSSTFGQATFDLFDQLYLTAAVRNDGSSTFGESERRHWFPKASAAWTFTKYTGDLGGNLTFGKLRAAYGETGQEPLPYQTLSAFTQDNLIDGGWGPLLSPTQGGQGGLTTGNIKGQDALKPERTKEFEFGLDLGLFKERADLGLTYYTGRSEDVIFLLPLPPSTGFSSQLANAGEISNRGFEATLNIRPVTTTNFNWEIGLQWARNRNRVEDLRGAEFVPMYFGNFGQGAAVKGEAVGSHLGFDFVRCGVADASPADGADIAAVCAGAPNGALYVGADGFAVLDQTQRIVGDPNPDWTGSLRSVVNWKKWQVSGLLDVKQGGDIWNGTRGALIFFGTHKDTEIRGLETTMGEFYNTPVVGPGANQTVTIDQGWFQGNGGGFGDVTSTFYEDGSFVKLREISLGYTLETRWLRDRVGLSSVDLRIAGRNLKTWTDYTGIDPETNLAGSETSVRGVDYFNNPQTRSFVFTVGLNR
ncbi:MAG: SusC/RagA family TonB-linked outer membrane protein [Anaerolineae bacterium]|nr:SusC/RagA family TonB-linked outer membrane protein [Gemmatimonadaceae bacterium]